MFKLIKYEFRKNRTGLLVLFVVALALYLMAQLGRMLESEKLMMLPAVLLGFYAFAAYVYVLVRGISAYTSEINSHSGYLLMMVPQTSLKILFAKLLFTFFFGLALFFFSVAALTGVMGILMKEAYGVQTVLEMLKLLMQQFNVDLNGLTRSLLFALGEVMISVLALVSMGYLSATLSATLLRQGRLRKLVNLAFFLLLLIAMSLLNRLVTPSPEETYLSFRRAMAGALPVLGINLALTLVFTGLSALLLKKKVCL